LAAKTLPNARLIAIPNPRKEKEAITIGNGGVQTIEMSPQVISAWAIIRVLPLPKRPRRASTKNAARMNPMALVTKMSDTTAYPTL